jgi:IS30 family transposase
LKRLDVKITSKNPTKDKGSKMSYKHLTLKERYLINAYKESKSQKEIARIIGVHPSTVSRELKRGKRKITGKYSPVVSENKAKKIQQEKSKKANLKLTYQVILLIKEYLKKEYSPEQISATLKLKHNKSISYVTIYSYIHSDKLKRGTLYIHLRHRGRRRAKYGKGRKNRIPERIFIENRPDIANKKLRIGDFEADTIIGKGRQEAIVTIVDRKSMYLKLSVPIHRKSHIVANEIVRLLSKCEFKSKVQFYI